MKVEDRIKISHIVICDRTLEDNLPRSQLNRRIRVAHLITNFAVGGAQDYLVLILRGLNQSRFEPHIAGRMVGGWVKNVQSLFGVKWHDIASLHREISPINDIKSIFQIKKFCEDNKIDILHTHSSKAGVVGRLGGYLANVPVIVHTVHGFSFHDFMPGWKKFAYVTIERLMSKYTTALLLYCNENKKTANELGIGAKKCAEVIYYGIDSTPFEKQFDRRTLRKSFGFEEDNCVIGFTGRLSEQKGLHILIEAFAQVRYRYPHVRLLLVGDGDLRKQLTRQIEKSGISNSVVITGFREDVPQLLRCMDIFAMTSFWEGLSRSLAEAMFAQLPIVATNVGGTGEAIRRGETGWLIPPKDVDSTARVIIEIIENPEYAKSLARSAYIWARTTFDIQTMHLKIAEFYESLLNHSHNI